MRPFFTVSGIAIVVLAGRLGWAQEAAPVLSPTRVLVIDRIDMPTAN